MTSIKERSCLAQRAQVFKAPTSLSSNRSDDKDYKNPLGSNEPEPSKAPAAPETPVGPKAPSEPPRALLPAPEDLDANQYSQQDLDKIIQTFLHTWKGWSGNKLKAKTPDVYCGKFHMECYHFY